MAKVRKSNYELLRILLMSMILYWHLVAHGILRMNDNPDFQQEMPSLWHLLVLPIRCYAVNCFILLSGYFGIKLTKQRFFSFSMQLLFYSFLTLGIYLMLPDGQHILNDLSIASWLKNTFPSGDTGWWFVTSYVIVMLLSPILNAGAEAISKTTFAWILIVTLGVFMSGYHYYTNSLPTMNAFFVMIYLIGRYLRLHPIRFVDKYCLWIWILSVLAIVGHEALLYTRGTLTSELFARISHCSNPFNIIAAIAFFCMFKKIDIGTSRKINWLAAGVFGAYLITDGYLRLPWNVAMVNIFGTNILILFVVAVAGVLLFSCFEHLRKQCQTPLDNMIWRYSSHLWQKATLLIKKQHILT